MKLRAIRAIRLPGGAGRTCYSHVASGSRRFNLLGNRLVCARSVISLISLNLIIVNTKGVNIKEKQIADVL